MQTNIDLLRHGEVLGGSCYRGITDDPLTAKGWQQMQDKLNGDTHWDVIISSPLSRCYQFATALTSKLQQPLISEPAFQEIDFGDWEGKTAEQIEPQLLSQFYADPVNFSPPNGEHFNDFQQRILVAWQALLEELQGNRILLISHAGVIRIILAHSLGLDIQHSFRLKIDHACLSSLEHFHSPEIESFYQLTKHG
ncbi:MAG: alpha-ribazole phosphatase family protein [Methylococcaceae bacterium]|nr:alpha-ribazole phosphatase family protein [Methylococcaceae bacterium]